MLIELCRQLAHIDKRILARQNSGVYFLVELGYYICHTVSDALNLELDFKNVNINTMQFDLVLTVKFILRHI